MDNNMMLKRVLARVQKPGRYTGGEPGSIIKEGKDNLLRFAFCFPDTYEVGMSYLGMKILYDLLNDMPNVWCERAFMPWVDMADELKKENIPLYTLESKDSLAQFDIVGFTLQYELSYTNILAMLDIGGIPLRASERGEDAPLVVAGGPCACNAEPLAEFFDAFFLGEGERQMPLVCNAVDKAKKDGISKKDLLRILCDIPGVYVPSLYDVSYNQDGTIKAIEAKDGAPQPVKKALLSDFDKFMPPEDFVVPMVGAVHDRAQIEVLRGCVRGCRFCQAGFLYRPMRQRSADMLNECGKNLCQNTGYEEISLVSLSTSDHDQLEELIDKMNEWGLPNHINLALPSLRVDNFTQSLAEKITKVRKSGLTFAPEAGTQRLRDVINKNVSEEEIERTCKMAFAAGYTSVKLYFMMGLPTETMEDIKGITDTAQRVVDWFYEMPKTQRRGGGVKVSISVACFVPKPMTPFQWCAQDSMETLKEKQAYLLSCVRGNRKISVKYHDSNISFLEAVFAKGDRRLCDVLEAAYKNGCRFDGWDDQFLFDVWMKTFDDLGISPYFYANRSIPQNEVTPWSHMNYGVDTKFLENEYKKACTAEVTPPCNKQCSACGASEFTGGGVCVAAP